MPPSTSLATGIGTSLALIDQFLSSINLAGSPSSNSQLPSNHPSPLHLLIPSATSLKSTVAKLSLLTITSPFTPSAVSSALHSLNTSVLPSLVTAVLLTSPEIYPEYFVKECNSLALATLRDLKVLFKLIKVRSEDGLPKNAVSEADKKNVTEATGKVWEDCDLLVQLSKEDVPGFAVRRAVQWLDLMRDAVKEFEEWDPAEEVGDDPFGLDDAQSEDDEEEGKDNTPEKNSDRIAMSAGVKDQALKVLSRIPQSIHVVVKQRLQKLPKETPSDPSQDMVPMSESRRRIIDKVLQKTRKISDCLDDSAEAMYMGDLELCLKKAGEARALTIEVVEAVLEPWEKSTKETKEDQYIRRALAWIQQVEPAATPKVANEAGKNKQETKP